MKAKLIINNQEIEVEISEEEIKKLQPKNKTGYERVEDCQEYYWVDWLGEPVKNVDNYALHHDQCYNISANYYSDRTVAENNARADKLMRQLRRFAVEHREKEIDWNDDEQDKWRICYEPIGAHRYLKYCISYAVQFYGEIYFDSEEIVKAAIDTFHDELIWYFTEYKDSL